MLRERWTVSLTLGTSEQSSKDVSVGNLGLEETMVPCQSCYIYGTWRGKEVGEGGFKVIIWGTIDPS